MEQDDPAGRVLAIFWWFFFTMARVFAIAIAFIFYPIPVLITLAVHYLAMLGYLFYYAKNNDLSTVFVNVWLGFVYVYGLIEYRIKFKYADKWLTCYCLFVFVQNVAFTLLWYFSIDDLEGYWYVYGFWLIFISMGLCIAYSVVYYLLFKPKEHKVYIS